MPVDLVMLNLPRRSKIFPPGLRCQEAAAGSRRSYMDKLQVCNICINNSSIISHETRLLSSSLHQGGPSGAPVALMRGRDQLSCQPVC